MASVTQLGRVMVPVSNQDEAIAFYTEKLGFTVAADVPFGEGDRRVEVVPPDGGASIALVPPRVDEWKPGRMTGIGLESADVRSARSDLREKGVDVDDEVMGGDGTVPLMFFFRDGDGNQLLLAEAQP